MKRQSSKAAKENRLRSKMRAEIFLERGPVCECCQAAPWCDLHEILSRGRGGSAVDKENILALCRECHHKITVNPAWAEGIGWSRSRTAEEHQKLFRPWEDTP